MHNINQAGFHFQRDVDDINYVSINYTYALHERTRSAVEV